MSGIAHYTFQSLIENQNEVWWLTATITQLCGYLLMPQRGKSSLELSKAAIKYKEEQQETRPSPPFFPTKKQKQKQQSREAGKVFK